MDEQQRQHILDDLRGFIEGELLFDDISRALYSCDASIFQVQPAGVVAPRCEEDVCQLVRYASENDIPLIARGAGSGVAGEALGRGLIVDMSRHFRSIIKVDSDSVRAQVGVTCRQLNDRLLPTGRRFAPDPASAAQCTIGGMLANNASGARVMRHGYTRDHVASLHIVMDNGQPAEVGREPVEGADNEHLQDILAAAALLLEDNAGAIAANRPKTPYDRCGYLLHEVLKSNTVDMPRLLAGSEGTLAIFTEATLNTIPIPSGRTLTLLGYAGLEQALAAAKTVQPTGPSACELVDRRLFRLAGDQKTAAVAALIPAEIEAILLVEYETDTKEEAIWAARRLPHLLARRRLEAMHVTTAFDEERMRELWQLREQVLPSLFGLKARGRPVAAIEDVGVPPDDLQPFLHQVQEILQEHEITASFLIHAGSGQVHARPFLDLGNPDDVAALAQITEKVHDLALEMGGSISTQHGTGIARTAWVARQYPQLYPVFRQLKSIFDPKNIFNPGKIVNPDVDFSRWPLRRPNELEMDSAPALQWANDEVRTEVLNCNGCGTCRVDAPSMRMCPVFHVTHAEAATPRAKANLFRHLLTKSSNGERPPLSSIEVRDVADLCVNCKMCATECPSRVNIPKLMIEAKAANVAEHGLDRQDWFFTHAKGFARWAGRCPPLANLALANRGVRWLLEKLFGLSAQRRLPRFAWRTFAKIARRRGWTNPRDAGKTDVVYFVDAFTNYHDPSIGEAAVAVLRHNGINVHVPAELFGCGMIAYALGDVETAKEIAQRNVQQLVSFAREGKKIVCSEPTAALMLSHDYLDLLDSDEVALVAANTIELTNFLWSMHRRGKLSTDFSPLTLTVGHHVPCHVKALGSPAAAPPLLELIPELNVQTIDVSCSGMAGVYGLKTKNRDASMEAGRRMLEMVKQPAVEFGSTECSACRLQMEDGASKRTLHPIQYLALAYGLLPEVRRRLREPIGKRTLR